MVGDKLLLDIAVYTKHRDYYCSAMAGQSGDDSITAPPNTSLLHGASRRLRAGRTQVGANSIAQLISFPNGLTLLSPNLSPTPQQQYHVQCPQSSYRHCLLGHRHRKLVRSYPRPRSPSPLRSSFRVDPNAGETESEDGPDYDNDVTCQWGL
jgi:hypothetical protein